MTCLPFFEGELGKLGEGEARLAVPDLEGEREGRGESIAEGVVGIAGSWSLSTNEACLVVELDETIGMPRFIWICGGLVDVCDFDFDIAGVGEETNVGEEALC